MADEKLGNGGHGLEAYDPETGRYIKDDVGADGVKKYHAGVHFSVGEIEKYIQDGYYGNDIKDYYDKADQTTKDRMIGYFQTKLDNFWTKQKLEGQRDFKTLTQAEFNQYGMECEKNTTMQDRNYFYHNYRGAGAKSFEFNKALRFGIDEFIKKFPGKLESVGFDKQKVEEQAAAFDRLADSFAAPQDMQGFRFDQTGPIVSWFGSSGVLDGLPKLVNQYGYEQLDQTNLDLDDLTARLSKLIGAVVPRDGAFSSFSCVEKQSHMIENPDRIIEIKYNIPKGKNCFISTYQYESEGFFPRNTKFIIQDVKKEVIGGQERVVLYYGVE